MIIIILIIGIYFCPSWFCDELGKNKSFFSSNRYYFLNLILCFIHQIKQEFIKILKASQWRYD